MLVVPTACGYIKWEPLHIQWLCSSNPQRDELLSGSGEHSLMKLDRHHRPVTPQLRAGISIHEAMHLATLPMSNAYVFGCSSGVLPVLDIVGNLGLICVLIKVLWDAILTDLVGHSSRCTIFHVRVQLPRAIWALLHYA